MPSTFLLSAPSIPSLSQASNNQSPVISSFQRFKDALRQRANGRTPLVDRILSNVEDKAKQIEADLEVMNEVDEASWCVSCISLYLRPKSDFFSGTYGTRL